MRLRCVFVAAVLGLGGCAAGARSPQQASESGEHECAIRLPSRQKAVTTSAVQLPSPVAAPSQLVVHAEIPLAPLKERLEGRVPQRLGEGRMRIGPGGTVSYRVDRGELSLSVTQTALLIEAPVHARAEACRGAACYASCEPEAVVRIQIPLLLRPDYRFAKSEATLRFTRGCEVRALGGLLSLDVTPTLAAALEPELENVSSQVDEQLPAVRSHIEQGWGELTQVRSLPLGGCFALQPVALVQGPFAVSSDKLAARFAVLANPELRVSCGDTPPSLPLPRTLAAAARVAPLLSASAFRDTAPSLASGLSQPTFDVSATVTSVSAAGATARGDQVVAWLEARGAIWLKQKQAADLPR